MRVGFLLLHPFSESMASGVRTIELAKALSNLGVEPIIFTPYEHSHFRDGVQIVNVPTFFSYFGIEHQFYNFTRRVYYSRELQKIVVKLSKKMTSGRVQMPSKLKSIIADSNLDILQAEQDNAALMLLSSGLNIDIPLVLDLHGIWPEELLAANAICEGSKDWIELQTTLKSIVDNVDLTVCLSDAMKNYVTTNYEARESDVAVVPPGGRVFCSEYSIRDLPFKVIYAGIISYRKHVDLFVRSMPYITQSIENVEFGITKRGELLGSIQKLAKSVNVQPAYFWFEDLKKTLKFLSSCHIGVLPSTNDTSAKLSMPSKLFDYMSVGLPVVANDVGGWTDIIKRYNLGRISEDNPINFANGIIELLSNPEELIRCGHNGIRAIKETYNWSKSADLLLTCYKRLLN
ncbi:MAG: glycosyltransferase family 4 protein [Candidatus Bathyarchaeota archaeon]|nr:glycosyltransferase family 4 protein [Candidatus Bathyarchaeota archaeon]